MGHWVAFGAGAITISWPASAAGYLLKGSPTLGAGATWTTVAGSPNPIAGAGSINVNVVAGGASYYRLEK